MIFHDWTLTDIIPSPDAWYQYQPGGSAGHVIYDSSGNERTLLGNESSSPVLTENVLAGHPAWYFNGTPDPLSWTGAVTLKHVFILASNEDATFDGYQGLLTGPTTGDVLVGQDAGTKFFDLGIGNLYSNAGTSYDEDNQQAPMSGTFRLLEVKNSGGIVLDGIQIGQQRALTARKWKGHFVEMIGFERTLSSTDIKQIRLYFNLKFGEFKRGLPFYFPSADIVPTIGPSRFYDEPADYKTITDSWEYEDATKDFNQVADEAPKFWEYAYPAVPKEQLPIFDEFWNQARLVNPFYFKDPEGIVWDNVRVETYNRNHPAHMRWRHDVAFRLVGYNSTGTPELPAGLEPAPTGLMLSLSTAESLIASWDGPPDDTAPSVPTMAASTGVTATTITWNWTAATDDVAVTGYDLQTAEDAGFTVNLQTYNLGDVLTYADTGLDPSTTYYARVSAHDAVPNSSAYSSSTSQATSAPMVLDLIGGTAAVAVGLRKMRSAYAGSCLRVRRASDNAEQDIGFDGESLDWADAISFKAASTISVVTWYDQSGNGKDMTAVADDTREPILDTSAEVVDFDGSNDLMRTDLTVDLSATDAVSVFLAGKLDAVVANQRVVNIYDGVGTNFAEIYDNGALCVAAQTVGGNSNNKYGTADTTARVYAAVFDRSQAGASDTKFYWDGVEQTNTGGATDVSGNFDVTSSVRIGEQDGGSNANMKAYELIVVASALSDPDREDVENNIIAYYGL